MNKHFKTVLLKTKKVITLGSPHRGSEAADTALDWNENGNWFQKWLLEEYGSVNDSMRFLSTASMADVNNQCIIFGTRNCPPLPKPFFMFSGGHGADMWAVYYETMSNHDLKIATLSPFADFPETHDGVVAQYSSEGLDLNAITYHQTERNHNHLRDDEFNPEGEMLMSALLKEFL